MENKNLGVLVAPPRPKDYILGGASSITVDRLVKDWSIYLPPEETQRNKVTDFLDCSTMSALHDLEMQMNYLLATNQLPDEALWFFHQGNYIVNGSFQLSARFNAKVNGTDKLKGQYLNAVGDSIRIVGILPKADYDMTDEMSFEDYYGPVPMALFEKAKKFLWFIDPKYQWVGKKDFPSVLSVSPVQVATEICYGWDSGQTVQKCSGQPLQHATVIYHQDVLGNWLDFDHYYPFKQLLAADYEFPLNVQYVALVKPLVLRKGMHGSNVLQLQKYLNKLGFKVLEDSDFGPKTEIAVISFQNKSALKADGKAGPLTMAKLKIYNTPRTLLEAIIQVESGGDDKAIGDKDIPDHAYGCLQIRQGVCDSVNGKFGTTYRAEQCLGNRTRSLDIWNKYWQVWTLLVTDEDRSRAWNGGPGWKQIYFKPNKTDKEINYCRRLDTYWTKVKSLL